MLCCHVSVSERWVITGALEFRECFYGLGLLSNKYKSMVPLSASSGPSSPARNRLEDAWALLKKLLHAIRRSVIKLIAACGNRQNQGAGRCRWVQEAGGSRKMIRVECARSRPWLHLLLQSDQFCRSCQSLLLFSRGAMSPRSILLISCHFTQLLVVIWSFFMFCRV